MYFLVSYFKHKTFYSASPTYSLDLPQCLPRAPHSELAGVCHSHWYKSLIGQRQVTLIGSVWFTHLSSALTTWCTTRRTHVTVMQVVSSFIFMWFLKWLPERKNASHIDFKHFKSNIAGGIRRTVNQGTSALCHLATPSAWCFELLDWLHRLTLTAKAAMPT